MAKKVNKSQAVREYLKDNPKATSGEIAAALNKKGVKITVSYAANLKTTITKGRKTKKAVAKPVAAPASPTTPEPEKTVKVGDAVTFEQLRAVNQAVKSIGGFARFNDLVNLIKEVGGLKKFTALLEAMSVPVTDEIPY
ncbi:MAG: hypothetical protein ABFC96_00580 [Thermoguttaceae bacterium]